MKHSDLTDSVRCQISDSSSYIRTEPTKNKPHGVCSWTEIHLFLLVSSLATCEWGHAVGTSWALQCAIPTPHSPQSQHWQAGSLTPLRYLPAVLCRWAALVTPHTHLPSPQKPSKNHQNLSAPGERCQIYARRMERCVKGPGHCSAPRPHEAQQPLSCDQRYVLPAQTIWNTAEMKGKGVRTFPAAGLMHNAPRGSPGCQGASQQSISLVSRRRLSLRAGRGVCCREDNMVRLRLCF